MKQGWFGPKRVGVGVRPSGWQGWLTMAAVVVVMLVVIAVVAER